MATVSEFKSPLLKLKEAEKPLCSAQTCIPRSIHATVGSEPSFIRGIRLILKGCLLSETNRAPRETLFQGGKGNHIRQAKMGSKLDRAAACSFPLLSCPEPPLKAAQRHGQHRHTDHLKHIFQSMRMLRHKVATACSTERKNCRRARSVGGFGGTAPTR